MSDAEQHCLASYDFRSALPCYSIQIMACLLANNGLLLTSVDSKHTAMFVVHT